VHLRAAISRKKKTLKLVFPSKQLSLRNSYHGYCKVKLYFKVMQTTLQAAWN